MFVTDRDYLRILHGGNFINFVCMVLDKDNKKSMVRTENFRLKVRRSCMLKACSHTVSKCIMDIAILKLLCINVPHVY